MDYAFTKIHNPEKVDDWSGIVWYNGVTDIPLDSPICGWQHELCQPDKTDNRLTVILLPTILGCFALGMIVVTVIVVKRYRYETTLKEIGDIKVSWEKLIIVDPATNVDASMQSLVQPTSAHIGDLKLVFYNDTIIVVESLGNNALNIKDRNVLVDLKNMRMLAHDNINPFIGICTEAPNVCYLMLYASRGSLQDIIADENMSLSMDFKISFILDIACGMWYIHQSPIETHGHLTSAKCVIDNRWACKITGHGLSRIKQLCGQMNTQDNNPAKLMWTAPERLNTDISNLLSPGETKKCDVFSFSIIAQEIFLKDLPYAANSPEIEAAIIVDKVKNMECPPYRPVIPTDACNEKWRKFIQDCWSDNPQQRPTFNDILYTINSIHRHKNMDLVDNMVKRLERYTSTLEERVAQRSLELQDEKHKVNILLKELLPPSVAQSLTLGHQVAPETFDNVTIFFSDIVGFTSISAEASPLEIVAMLNSMYTMFDDLAQNYDVYKVATIGDAYMVASGVPIRNGDRHATEICAMSLALLGSIKDFPIPHLPGEHLSMRIGIYSGPCVAGVAGIKMPRYLLFGDTVDIAARMESSGKAMKVQIGDTTVRLIRNDQQFQLQLRGQIEMKGTFKVETYWLETSSDCQP